MGSQVKNWCFTLNNFTEIEERKIKDFIQDECVFGIFQHEIGENGTPHLQGYFQLKTKKRLSFVKSHVSSRAHFETAKGTALDFINKFRITRGDRVFVGNKVTPNRISTTVVKMEEVTNLNLGPQLLVQDRERIWKLLLPQLSPSDHLQRSLQNTPVNGLNFTGGWSLSADESLLDAISRLKSIGITVQQELESLVRLLNSHPRHTLRWEPTSGGMDMTDRKTLLLMTTEEIFVLLRNCYASLTDTLTELNVRAEAGSSFLDGCL